MRFAVFLLLGLLAAIPANAAEDKVVLWRGDSAITQAEDLLKQKKYAESLGVLERIIQRNIRNADAHVYTAMAWYGLGDFQKAEASLKNALAIDRGHMGAYVMAGRVALQQGNRGQAEYYFNALRVACQSDTCVEVLALKKALREYKEKEDDDGFF